MYDSHTMIALYKSLVRPELEYCKQVWNPFLPARVLAVVVCLSVCVCLSDTRRYSIKTAKRRITITTPRDSPETLVFWRQESLVADDPQPLPLKFALKMAQPLTNTTISTKLFIAPQP